MAVFAVTVGAIQLNVQLLVALGDECTSSPLRIFEPVPAVNVPAVEATSTPPVVPGPLMVTV